MKIAIIGCGWLGQQLAAELTASGHQVYGSRRSAAELAHLPTGTTGFVLDLNAVEHPDSILPVLHDAVVICAITPGRSHSQQHYVAALQQLAGLAATAGSRQMLHFSSTGIYQGLQGEVDESASLQLSQPRVSLLWQGEQALQQLQPAMTLRLAGLMGPGRHPGRFIAGKPLSHAAAPVNMLHVADIIGAVKLILDSLPCSGIFNLSCPHTETRRQFYQQAGVAAGTAPVVFDCQSADGRKVSAEKFIRQFSFYYRFRTATAALVYCD